MVENLEMSTVGRVHKKLPLRIQMKVFRADKNIPGR